MTQRTAHMDLNWEELGSDKEGWHEYWSLLPDIPGYPYADGFQGVVTVADTSDDGDDGPFVDGVFPEETDWGFDMSLGLVAGDGRLTNEDFGIPDTGTAEEMMDIVDKLSVEDIEDALTVKGYEPVDATAARHASTKRFAHMDVDWWQTSAGTWAGDLPDIPGYPKPGGGHYTVGLDTIVNDDDETIGYGFNMNIIGPDVLASLWEDDFGFSYAATVEEAKQQVESLSPEEIADAATAKGGEPEEG